MKIRTVTDTIHHAQGKDVEALLLEKYDITVDFVRECKIPGDDSGGFVELPVFAHKAAEGRTTLENFSSFKSYLDVWLITYALSIEADDGNVPEGTYHVHFYWG